MSNLTDFIGGSGDGFIDSLAANSFTTSLVDVFLIADKSESTGILVDRISPCGSFDFSKYPTLESIFLDINALESFASCAKDIGLIEFISANSLMICRNDVILKALAVSAKSSVPIKDFAEELFSSMTKDQRYTIINTLKSSSLFTLTSVEYSPGNAISVETTGSNYVVPIRTIDSDNINGGGTVTSSFWYGTTTDKLIYSTSHSQYSAIVIPNNYFSIDGMTFTTHTYKLATDIYTVI